MELSVVVSTLNDREQLLSCLDALAERTPPSTEVIVVNGPSSDGTSGIVRERADVDVLVEISERNPNVSRNAGLGVATGDVVAFLDGECTVEASWYDAIERSLETECDVVTGPITGRKSIGDDGTRTVVRRRVTFFDADNVAFDRTVLSALDGFDEYLEDDGARDCAHRVAGLGFEVSWEGEMAVRSEIGADGGTPTVDWGARYRSLSYRLAKNYGPRPSVVARTVASALRDGVGGVRRVVSGEETPTGWVADGIDVVTNAAAGLRDGLRARYADRSARRNPNGLSVRHDRAVRLYDRRESDG
ncbi:glycosyltransferase family 2 protein [Natrarchaeobius oligotrophus]|uniref:Glycosyltransferase family 2 protein n=1 Tax=Natrarchaeobius chitinivorans TaxID=1679083 RepID=A0A3N6NSL2_NATCH|nr:glycosyltransferase family A protein [Natrarchaeobius chitinivorans]RQH03223.1 glycosyltransferase family 2 protein [Natrarchaeobius chitinivorans]